MEHQIRELTWFSESKSDRQTDGGNKNGLFLTVGVKFVDNFGYANENLFKVDFQGQN